MTQPSLSLPSVNGVPLLQAGEQLDPTTLRQRACTELLRQAAVREGYVTDAAAPWQHGAIDEHVAEAIERMLDARIEPVLPDEADCRRYFEANSTRYAVGEAVHARHVLFAVTDGVDVNALRSRAEACLLDLRTADADSERFASVAKEMSNCPSGAQGGELGWLVAEDCAPEMRTALFGSLEVGVLPRLVHSRFGLHVMDVRERRPGQPRTYEQAREAVHQTLTRQAYATALHHWLDTLGASADLVGVDLQPA